MMTPEEKEKRKLERKAIREAKKAEEQKLKEEQKAKELEEYKEKMLNDTARLMFNVFNKDYGTYSKEFEDLLLSGGGGNSMFVNCWAKPSSVFIKSRISGKAKAKLSEYGYASLWDSPHEFRHNNAKGAENRIANGKHLHLDHNPGNVKVLQLIKDKCRSYDLKTQKYDDIIADLKKYLSTIQTLDWITVEQDDVRTYQNDSKDYSKKEKDMMDHKQRDDLLKDTWEYL